MKKIFKIFSTLLIFAVACQPAENNKRINELIIQGSAQGTTYTVKYLGNKLEALPSELDSLLLAIDQSLSTYDTTSLITSFNNGDTIVPDRLFTDMILFSKELNAETNGAFDPTIGPLIRSWGFGFSNAEKMDSLKVDSLLALKGFDKVYLSENELYLLNKKAKLNFNAIAQGYSVDLMARLLEDHHIYNYYVELGGEIKVKGKNSNNELWRIGIDKPEEGNETRELAAIIQLENRSMATSGNYRRFYEKEGVKYSHTLDPQNGYPVQHSLLSATVISRDCYRADALATAFMVMGLDESVSFLEKHPEDWALLIYSEEDGKYGFYNSPELDQLIERVGKN